MSARDISNCAMQSSNWLVLFTYNAVTAAKSAQARSSRKSGRAIERRRREIMPQIPRSRQVHPVSGSDDLSFCSLVLFRSRCC